MMFKFLIEQKIWKRPTSSCQPKICKNSEHINPQKST